MIPGVLSLQVHHLKVQVHSSMRETYELVQDQSSSQKR